MSQEDAALLDAGVAAARRGDMRAAHAHLAAMASPPALMLAQVCNRLGDDAGEADALGALLRTEPRHLQALLAMGELKLRTGDERAATSFFRTALGQAAVSQTDPKLAPHLDRARQLIEQSGAQFSAFLTSRMDYAQQRPRIRAAIDLLLGRSELYLQQPSVFYFPGLAQRPFFEREEFDWVEQVERHTDAMIAELQAVRQGSDKFQPYVETTGDRPAPNNPLRDDPSWGAFYFLRNGKPVEEHAALCPATMTALESAPLPRIEGRAPMALWSRLLPGTHIAPHNGLLNTRLICHLPLLVPEGCAFRVGAETRPWETGKLLIFDDSIQHEAWNRGPDERVILLFEIWRPDIDEEERMALSRLFQLVDHYGQDG